MNEDERENLKWKVRTGEISVNAYRKALGLPEHKCKFELSPSNHVWIYRWVCIHCGKFCYLNKHLFRIDMTRSKHGV